MNIKEIITFGAEVLHQQQVMNGNDSEEYKVDVTDTNDKHLLYYNWLADNATTAHVTNQCEAFMKYYPANDATVVGVGNMRINIQGCGTVLLESQVNDQIFILELESVLHVPMMICHVPC